MSFRERFIVFVVVAMSWRFKFDSGWVFVCPFHAGITFNVFLLIYLFTYSMLISGLDKNEKGTGRIQSG